MNNALSSEHRKAPNPANNNDDTSHGTHTLGQYAFLIKTREVNAYYHNCLGIVAITLYVKKNRNQTLGRSKRFLKRASDLRR